MEPQSLASHREAQFELSGHFSVMGDDCIKCASCSTLAPAIFHIETDGAHITRQPADAIEFKECQAAMINCPTSAIVCCYD